MRLLLVNLSLLACLLGLSTVVVPINAAPVPKDEPKRPKTTAEKLVGKWKFVRLPGGHPASPELDSTMELTKNGKVIDRSTDPKHGHREESGTYTLMGNVIRFFYKSRPLPQDQHFSVTIKQLTRDKLVFSAPFNLPNQGYEYTRVAVGKDK